MDYIWDLSRHVMFFLVIDGASCHSAFGFFFFFNRASVLISLRGSSVQRAKE
jgi:hypothetical protein